MRIYIQAARRAAVMALRRGSAAGLARVDAIDAARQTPTWSQYERQEAI